MGESGQIVSFPMNPEKMVAEVAAKRRLVDIRRKSYGENKKPIVYEMAESGILFEFPESVVKSSSENIAKAGNP